MVNRGKTYERLAAELGTLGNDYYAVGDTDHLLFKPKGEEIGSVEATLAVSAFTADEQDINMEVPQHGFRQRAVSARELLTDEAAEEH